MGRCLGFAWLTALIVSIAANTTVFIVFMHLSSFLQKLYSFGLGATHATHNQLPAGFQSQKRRIVRESASGSAGIAVTRILTLSGRKHPLNGFCCSFDCM